jgi:hypothetical protein
MEGGGEVLVINSYTSVRQVLCILWVDFSNGFQPIVVGETCIEPSRNEMHKTWRCEVYIRFPIRYGKHLLKY